MALIPDYTFMPVVHHQAKSILWSADPKTPQQWEDVFRCAYSVHFYSHYNDHRKVGFVAPPPRDTGKSADSSDGKNTMFGKV